MGPRKLPGGVRAVMGSQRGDTSLLACQSSTDKNSIGCGCFPLKPPKKAEFSLVSYVSPQKPNQKGAPFWQRNRSKRHALEIKPPLRLRGGSVAYPERRGFTCWFSLNITIQKEPFCRFLLCVFSFNMRYTCYPSNHQ